jgi:hypothetical protein
MTQTIVQAYLHVYSKPPPHLHGTVNKIVVAEKYAFWESRGALLEEDKQVDCIMFRNHHVTLKSMELSP